MVTRRRFLLTAASLSTAVLGLSACNGSAQPTAEAPMPAAGGVEPGAYPATVNHKFGATVVEREPLRVVTVGLKEQDDCLAVGVVPVASTKWFSLGSSDLVGPWATAALGAAPAPQVLTDNDGINFEQVAAQAPDLIIAVYSDLKQADYDKLTALAPTIAQSKDHDDWGVPWDVQATMVGQALGRPARMAGLVTDAKQKIADTAAAHPEFAGKTAVTATPYEGIFVYGVQDPRPRMLTELGFVLPADLDQATGSAWGGQLSRERVDLLDTDAIVWFVEETGRSDVEKNKTYASLRVHREGREVFTEPGDSVYEAFSFLTVLSVGYLAETLAPRLQAALDGNPDTGTS